MQAILAGAGVLPGARCREGDRYGKEAPYVNPGAGDERERTIVVRRPQGNAAPFPQEMPG